MKKTILIDDKYAVSDAMRDLKVYLTMMYLAPEESFFSEEVEMELMEYFRSKNPKVESEYEKMLVDAVVKSCIEDPDIPKDRVVKVAGRMAREFRECIKTAKRTYQHLCAEGPFEGLVPGSKAALRVLEREKKQNTFLNKAGFRLRLKKVVKRIAVFSAEKKAAFITAMKFTGGNVVLSEIISVAVTLANRVIPKTVREKIQAEAKQVRELVRMVTKQIWTEVSEKLSETKVGQVILEAVETVGSVVKEVGQAVKGVVKELSLAGKKVYQKISDKVRQARKWVKIRRA